MFQNVVYTKYTKTMYNVHYCIYTLLCVVGYLKQRENIYKLNSWQKSVSKF